MNVNQFSKKYDIDLISDFFSLGKGSVFFIESFDNIFTSPIINIQSTLQTITGIEKICNFEDLFDKIDPYNELVLDTGESVYVNILRFKLENSNEICFLPLNNGQVFGISFFKYPDKNIIVGYCYKLVNLFSKINDYLSFAFKNPISKLFNRNMFRKHLEQMEDKQETYLAIIDISNLYENCYKIDDEAVNNYLKIIARVLLNETYSKVCVYHIKDTLFAIKLTDLDENEVEELLERVHSNISKLNIDGFIPIPYMGYIKYDSRLHLEHLEIGRYAYLATMLAHKEEEKILFLDNSKIKEFISKYGSSINTVKKLELKDF